MFSTCPLTSGDGPGYRRPVHRQQGDGRHRPVFQGIDRDSQSVSPSLTGVRGAANSRANNRDRWDERRMTEVLSKVQHQVQPRGRRAATTVEACAAPRLGNQVCGRRGVDWCPSHGLDATRAHDWQGRRVNFQLLQSDKGWRCAAARTALPATGGGGPEPPCGHFLDEIGISLARKRDQIGEVATEGGTAQSDCAVLPRVGPGTKRGPAQRNSTSEGWRGRRRASDAAAIKNDNTNAVAVGWKLGLG